MDYQEFITGKVGAPKPRGLSRIPKLPAALKPFQKDVVTWALRQGSCAIFAGTGLGKTLQQLAWADAMATFTGKPTLILTPLAVAQQTVGEAKKFGIKGVAYAREPADATSRIVVTNYDRAERFDMTQFGALVADESSILKSHDSKTRVLLTKICACIPYKLCCTATPAPNDYQELGQHAEFLGVLKAKEMLATWFVRDGSGKATNATNRGSKPTADWRLKGHAERDFWRWLSTWAVVIRHPRDIGYHEPGYDLPELRKHQITVSVDYEDAQAGGTLFAIEARTLQERRAAARGSVATRAAAAADLVARDPGAQWLIWCNLNDEADALTSAISDAVEVRGPDDPDIKAERLLGFASGDVRILVSKPKIAGFGMNWQRCNKMIFTGLTDSFEQTYQAIRRCWRFGQTQPVDVYMIAAETEGAVVANLDAKEKAADYMLAQMAEHMKDLTKRSLRGAPIPVMREHNSKMEVPTWLS